MSVKSSSNARGMAVFRLAHDRIRLLGQRKRGVARKNTKTRSKRPPRRRLSPAIIKQQNHAAEKRQKVFFRRLTCHGPVAWNNEPLVDVVVCDPQAARKQLDQEKRCQADLVRRALALVRKGDDDQAHQLLKDIPRRSPLAEWRRFIVGLSAWYNGKLQEADQHWDRLDPERRPARIARILKQSNTASEDSKSKPDNPTAPQEDDPGPFIQLVKSVRVTRPGLEELAEKTASAPPRDTDDMLKESLAQWLISWRTMHKETEPDLVKQVETVALGCAFRQPDRFIMEQLVEEFTGPPHDPKNRLLMLTYISLFEGSEHIVEELFTSYTKHDLPRCESLDNETRQALMGLLYRDNARRLRAPQNIIEQFLLKRQFRLGHPDLDRQNQVEAAYKDSIKAFPANSSVHREYIEWIENSVTQRKGTNKAQKEMAERKIQKAMECWTQSVPEEAEPRLWLVDHYLDSGDMDAAKPHVTELQRQRMDDPLVRALPWRWHLLDAMQLARRKRNVSLSREALAQAEANWPKWLSESWIPFLQAALAWRAKDEDRTEQYQQAMQSVGNRPLLADVMMFAAFQRMHIPSAELRPLRQKIEEHLEAQNQILIEDFLGMGTFFWSLTRCNLRYPGYRTHGSKLGKALCERLEDDATGLKHPDFGTAILWMSEHKFWGDSQGFRLPSEVAKIEAQHPMAAAATMNGLRQYSSNGRLTKVSKESYNLVKSEINNQTDSLMRYFLQRLVDNCTPLADTTDTAQIDLDDFPSWLDF